MCSFFAARLREVISLRVVIDRNVCKYGTVATFSIFRLPHEVLGSTRPHVNPTGEHRGTRLPSRQSLPLCLVRRRLDDEGLAERPINRARTLRKYTHDTRD